ncbi:MAG: hypothetical protein QHJ73_17945, partial [Armatimonadota bacterium]|nr:hypothetical protein [Armatimonadota bacterium]
MPWGAWSYHPAANGEPCGVFVRFFPDGYEATALQVYVPEPLRVTVDPAGRLSSLQDRHGWRIEVQYATDVPPLTFAGDPDVTGYALSAVRLSGLDAHDPRETRHAEYHQVGWVLLGVPNGQGQAAAPGERYPDAQQRYDAAVAHRHEVTALQGKIAAVHPRRGPGEESVVQNLLALAGLALSLVFLVVGVAYGGYIYATEVPDGYSRISFNTMRPDEIQE